MPACNECFEDAASTATVIIGQPRSIELQCEACASGTLAADGGMRRADVDEFERELRRCTRELRRDGGYRLRRREANA